MPQPISSTLSPPLKPQASQQQREAFLIAPLPEPGTGDPARSGYRVPIAALGLVRIHDLSNHLAITLPSRPYRAKMLMVCGRRAAGKPEAWEMSANCCVTSPDALTRMAQAGISNCMQMWWD